MGRVFFALVFVVLAHSVWASQSKSVEAAVQEADALIQAGEPEQAYAILAPLEAILAGNYRYDYLLGIAALDTNRPVIASLALERVLLVEPRFAGARMDLGRAYYAIGDLARAQEQFKRVMAYGPPPQVRESAASYLGAIEQKLAAGDRRPMGGYASLRIGHDSNVTSAPDLATLEIPALPGIIWTLDGTSREESDAYAQLAAGWGLRHPLKEGVELSAGIDLKSRHLGEVEGLNQEDATGRVGFTFSRERDAFSLGANGGSTWLDTDRIRDTYGVTAAWQHVLAPTTAVTVFGQHNRLRHTDDALTSNDIDQTLFGYTLTRAFPKTTASGGFYVGEEQSVGTRPDGDKSIFGVSLGVEKSVSPSVVAYSNFGLQQGSYDEINPAFLVQRSDTTLNLAAGAVWQFNDDWSLQAEWSRAQNSSNVSINSYARTDVSLTVRRDF